MFPHSGIVSVPFKFYMMLKDFANDIYLVIKKNIPTVVLNNLKIDFDSILRGLTLYILILTC